MKKHSSKNLKRQQITSLTILILGLVLVTFMIKYEDEPGALPLFLILAGTIWFAIIQTKIKKSNF